MPQPDTRPTTPATEPFTETGKALEREIGGDYGEIIAAIEAEAGMSPLAWSFIPEAASPSTRPTTPRIGVCIEHGSAAEWHDDSGQCLYCCQVETSCQCTEASRLPRSRAAIDLLYDPEPTREEDDIRRAVYARAEAASPSALDVERLTEAGGNVLDGRRIGSVRLYRNTITPDDWQAIAAEYARLSGDGGEGTA